MIYRLTLFALSTLVLLIIAGCGPVPETWTTPEKRWTANQTTQPVSYGKHAGENPAKTTVHTDGATSGGVGHEAPAAEHSHHH